MQERTKISKLIFKRLFLRFGHLLGFIWNYKQTMLLVCSIFHISIYIIKNKKKHPKNQQQQQKNDEKFALVSPCRFASKLQLQSGPVFEVQLALTAHFAVHADRARQNIPAVMLSPAWSLPYPMQCRAKQQFK